MRVPVLVTTILLAAALTACGSDTADSSAGGGTASPSPSDTSASPSPATPSGLPSPSGPQPTSRPTIPPPAEDDIPVDLDEDPRVQAALADARGRAGVVPAEVLIAGYREVTWDDGSLGCPVKGRSYTQARVDGELLLLRADQRVLSYHSARGGPFEYCATPSGAFSPRA
ncbi:hypothetical protein [Nostocoides sp. Soil756]|jgi:hypothetical protein|uniref:hypothetical protein n=1 Tax=Nostocoides sp. Soil756 TaxID=1736399 RepID=UPI0006F509DD|nr:hypothetical protein [Tetrasphaera sp. Soil756]KRE60635.1 hypothetical protein ASG78_13970 [Tetrasphaera sp. Soil756]